MKFQRRSPMGYETPAVLIGDTTYDISCITPDIDGKFLSGTGPEAAQNALDAGKLAPLEDQDARVGAPIAQPTKIVCVGLNYRDHADETGAEYPTEPVVFMKDPSTIIGPFDSVPIPRGSVKTDWEVELGIVIGKTARYLSGPEEAHDYIAGYVLSHDVSEREFQLERGGQWVNGTMRQNGSTANQIFNVAHIVWYLSQFMVLRPGDLVNTGTPAGVALGLPGQPYLTAGDVVELEIDGLGACSQTFVAADVFDTV
ncbi:fumarylacetoacetate hydrolase family protein [Arthrobacter sp. CDRTa11]|uniref:fumarylacetoacetate hydrolase family protein n=1 Tax=Arthrobacter sp. CDRTa11 TaxID=2651199 RepID=UPI002265A556|nr:fumarylacetoacetate hydrolase family protein [Arthrobacter sp. CDRTa11]UZX02942.1 fumarylacetoacetate hydrolase family protein [Arthrobacter sp. CDRTa11]